MLWTKRYKHHRLHSKQVRIGTPASSEEWNTLQGCRSAVQMLCKCNDVWIGWIPWHTTSELQKSHWGNSVNSMQQTKTVNMLTSNMTRLSDHCPGRHPSHPMMDFYIYIYMSHDSYPHYEGLCVWPMLKYMSTKVYITFDFSGSNKRFVGTAHHRLEPHVTKGHSSW